VDEGKLCIVSMGVPVTCPSNLGNLGRFAVALNLLKWLLE